MKLFKDSRGHAHVALLVVVVFAVVGAVLFKVSNAQTPPKKLDAKIAAYVKAHYPGWQAGKKQLDPECDNTKAYDVPISKAGKTSFSLIFRPDGTFVQTEKDVSYSKAPKKLKSNLKAYFPHYTYGDTYENIKLANGERRWLVDLSKKGHETNEVIMRTDGTVLCTRPPISGFPPTAPVTPGS